MSSVCCLNVVCQNPVRLSFQVLKKAYKISSFEGRCRLNVVCQNSSDNDTPFLSPPRYLKQNQKNLEVKILLKRWVKVQLEGQDSKVFSKGEEIGG